MLEVLEKQSKGLFSITGGPSNESLHIVHVVDTSLPLKGVPGVSSVKVLEGGTEALRYMRGNVCMFDEVILILDGLYTSDMSNEKFLKKLLLGDFLHGSVRPDAIVQEQPIEIGSGRLDRIMSEAGYLKETDSSGTRAGYTMARIRRSVQCSVDLKNVDLYIKRR